MESNRSAIITVMQNFPLIGAHMSIAGGFANAVRAAKRYHCTALQIFTKNQRQWRIPQIKDDDIKAYFDELESSEVSSVVAHATYLINLAAPDKSIFDKSLETFIAELFRSHKLGAFGLVFHPGSHKGRGEKVGLDMVVDAIRTAIAESSDLETLLIIETTAGQGTNLGYKFEQIAYIIEHVGHDDRIGVCLDTCHVFAAGYDIRTPETYERTIAHFDDVIGLKFLKVIHLNDSKGGLGSRIDRHTHLGYGQIGAEAFRLIMQDERFIDVPKIIETPKLDDWDAKNLGLLRRFWNEKFGNSPPKGGHRVVRWCR